jgi:ABC-2 type transport system ATP-binding protein
MKQRLIVVDTPENLRRDLYGRRIAFHVRPADLQYAPALQELPFVHKVQSVTLSDGASAGIVVDLEDPVTQNPVIVRKLVECAADVQFVGEMRHSLEEVYLKLINS